MRLSSLQLSGFKSFVGPLRIDFPTRLTGVVGPNGCGKSNVIDAVRWVLGESSRNIRGESLGDIIFDGSSATAPLDQASVEMVLNNEEGRIGGEYAGFSEIKLRREVNRDAEHQSRYYINGTRARRKDVSEMFQGTGLGRGNYAIIAQGMVQGLIEAKPEDMRKYIEEAAGISLYRERRRETENKINRTEENLEQSRNILAEYEQRLKHLARQKKQAEQYQKLCQDLRERESEWVSLKLQVREAEWEAVNREHAAIEEERVTKQAHFEELEASREAQRVKADEVVNVMNAEQADFYQLQADCGECERLQEEIKNYVTRIEVSRESLGTLRKSQEGLQAQLDQATAQRTQMKEQADSLEEERRERERGREEIGNQRTAARETCATEEARQRQYEDELRHLQGAGEESDREKDAQDRLGDELQEAEARRNRSRQQLEENEEQAQQAQRQRDVQVQAHQQLQEKRMEVRARLASLEAMQQSELAADAEAHGHALESMQLKGTRLADQIEVEAGWEFAVETALAERLGAFCVDRLPEKIEDARISGTTALLLLEPSRGEPAEGLQPLLVQRIKRPRALASLLAGVLTADTIEEAYALQSSLQPHQSVITQSGLWLGPDWVRVPATESRAEGVLERQREIDSLGVRVEQLDAELLECERQRDAAKREVAQAEERRGALQKEYDEAFAAFAHVSARAQSAEGQAHRKEDLQRKLEESQRELKEAQARLNELEPKWQQLDEDYKRLSQACDEAQQKQQAQADQCGNIQAQLSVAQAQIESTESSLNVDEEARQSRLERIRVLLGGEAELTPEEQEQRLQAKRKQLDEMKGRMQEAKQTADALREEQTTLDAQLAKARQEADETRERMHEKDLSRQSIRDACEQLRGQLREGGREAQEVLAALPEDATVEVWEEQVERLQTRLERMPPINAAAISEHEEVSEQVEELKQRHADIESALQKLQDAIARIDRETRERFRRTYEEVNTNLRRTFPRIIGEGGEANLALTEQNLLTTGVEVHAKPPGKRYRSMHMLSGGEQAMAAASLILSLFLLNPAPFCILDEVDAPLSDDNLRRFCEILVEMSEGIQFIVVTHNKITMEHVEQLIGVTMNEPGVSRLVSVNVAEAVAMSESDGPEGAA